MRKKETEKRISAVAKQTAALKADLINEVNEMLSKTDDGKVNLEDEEDQPMVSYDGGGDPQNSTLYANIVEVSSYKGNTTVHVSTHNRSADIWLADMPYDDVVTVWNTVKARV